MEVRIHIPRPLLTLAVIAALGLWFGGVLQFRWGADDDAQGGRNPGEAAAEAKQDIDRERIRQAVLERREEILRYQLQVLEAEALATDDPENIEETNEARKTLLAIIRERSASEELLRRSLEQLWEAEGSLYTLRGMDIETALLWPVSPRLGISARFEDNGYEKRFGIPHHAVDIPIVQGSEIQAPAPGTVTKVALNGLGYSFVVIDHGNGLETVYGHISTSLVSEGQSVNSGDPIALSGGTPGTEGAGLLTTGPHVHFAVKVRGVLVNPLKYLPKL